ncbi:MAG: hypothetical protein WCJ30_17735, partial [Deltaproteobacteria bacterium]
MGWLRCDQRRNLGVEIDQEVFCDDAKALGVRVAHAGLHGSCIGPGNPDIGVRARNHDPLTNRAHCLLWVVLGKRIVVGRRRLERAAEHHSSDHRPPKARRNGLELGDVAGSIDCSHERCERPRLADVEVFEPGSEPRFVGAGGEGKRVNRCDHSRSKRWLRRALTSSA